MDLIKFIFFDIFCCSVVLVRSKVKNRMKLSLQVKINTRKEIKTLTLNNIFIVESLKMLVG